MDEKIKLNYPAMQDMATHCRAAAGRLQETSKIAQQTALQMEAGTLVGNAGNIFNSALRDGLTPSVNKLAEKLNEIARDIESAISDMQAQDGSAGNRFTGGR